MSKKRRLDVDDDDDETGDELEEDEWYHFSSDRMREILSFDQGERVFSCKACKKSFKTFTYLQNHANKKHDFDQKVACRFCDTFFSDFPSCFNHMYGQHIIPSRSQTGAGVNTRSQSKPSQSSVSPASQAIHSHSTISVKRKKTDQPSRTEASSPTLEMQVAPLVSSTDDNSFQPLSSKYPIINSLLRDNTNIPSTSSAHSTSSERETNANLNPDLSPIPAAAPQPNLQREEDGEEEERNPNEMEVEENRDREVEYRQGGRRIRIIDELDAPPRTEDEELNAVIQSNWGAIRSRRRLGRVMETLTVRIWNGALTEADERLPEIWNVLRDVWRENPGSLKINCSFGCILENKNDGSLRYFHASSNNATLFSSPRLIRAEEDLEEFYTELSDSDLRQHMMLQRPSTVWRLRHITNVSFYFYHLLFTGKVGCGDDPIPSHVRTNRYIWTYERYKGKMVKDNLCFFRCLAASLNCKCGGSKDGKCQCKWYIPKSIEVCSLLKKWQQFSKIENEKEFQGVTMFDLIGLEKCFNIRINVIKFEPTGDSTTEWISSQCEGRKLFLDLHNNHFSYVANIDKVARLHSCPTCNALFSRNGDVKRHSCKTDQSTEMVFEGGQFKPPPTVFSNLREKAGIEISESSDLQYYPFVITYDIESYMDKDNLLEDTKTTSFTAKHELLSVSVCSNVPGFEKPKCIVTKGDSECCVEEFVAYLMEISETAAEIMEEKFKDILDLLEKKIETALEREKPYADSGFSSKRAYKKAQIFGGLDRQLRDYLICIPVVGFNSQKYDLNVMKGLLLREIQRVEGADFKFVVKKSNNLACIKSRRLQFLDILNYLAPGYSYAQYLKAFKCSAEKGFFPYEWFDSLAKLDFPSLPKREDFYSSLKGCGISEEDYSICQEAWKKNDMKTMRDFLVWYNNLDVEPFVQAVEKQKAVYRSRGIDMWSAISLPGLSVRWMFKDIGENVQRTKLEDIHRFQDLPQELKKSQRVCLIDENNRDLHDLIKGGIVGGPSVVFHRRHIKGETRIREREYGDKAKLCDNILGVDANALYLWCMMQDMPVGYPRRMHAKDQFITEKLKGFSKVAHAWLEWVSFSKHINIRHSMNGGEQRIGKHNLPVDGFCVETGEIFQFHGCFWHGHPCSKTKGVINHPVRNKAMEELYEDTVKKEEYLRHLGYTVNVMWECDWDQMVKKSPKLKVFLKLFYQSLHPKNSKPLQLEDCIKKIADGSFYGFVECDISVPKELEHKFSEMAPIFKNAEVSREHLSEHMREFAEESGALKQPQKMLIGSLFGKKILLLSTLVQWYLKHGLRITRIYQMVEYIPQKCFKTFGESVSNARRKGDLDPTEEINATTYKLVGNSFYGKTITDKEKHQNVSL